MRKTLTIFGLALFTTFVFVQPARADSVANFSVIGSGIDITFSLPDTFIPASISGSTAVVHNIMGTLLAGNPSVFNYGAVSLGTSTVGMTNVWFFGSVTPGFMGPQIGFFAPTLVTFNADGTVTINPGTYSFGAIGGPGSVGDVTVTGGDGTIGTPEPASLALVSFGALALLGLRRRKTA